MHSIIDYLATYVSLSQEEIKEVESSFELNFYEKGKHLLLEGKRCRYLYFIDKGACRSYTYHKGKDVTNWIYIEGGFCTIWSSFFTKEPSQDFIEVTVDADIYRINFEKLDALYQKHPKVERAFRMIVETELAGLERFYSAYFFISAKEKYLRLLEFSPMISQFANLGHIASMLGVSQETLSRVRKEVMKEV